MEGKKKGGGRGKRTPARAKFPAMAPKGGKHPERGKKEDVQIDALPWRVEGEKVKKKKTKENATSFFISRS